MYTAFIFGHCRSSSDYMQAEDLRLKISHARLATGPVRNSSNSCVVISAFKHYVAILWRHKQHTDNHVLYGNVSAPRITMAGIYRTLNDWSLSKSLSNLVAIRVDGTSSLRTLASCTIAFPNLMQPHCPEAVRQLKQRKKMSPLTPLWRSNMADTWLCFTPRRIIVSTNC